MFPARAGMSPAKPGTAQLKQYVPCASGDELVGRRQTQRCGECSLRERG